MIEFGRPEAIVCAANALAAAEQPRAIFPLIKQAQDHPDTTVQTASIRALGLIRDRIALPALREIVVNQDASPAVVAAALVALLRLNEINFGQLFEQIFKPEMMDDALKTRLYQILTTLYNTTDGAVFSKRHITEYLQHLIDHDPNLQQLNSANTTHTEAALKAIGVSGNRQMAPLVFLPCSSESRGLPMPCNATCC